MASNGTLSPSDSMTLRDDGAPTVSHSPEEQQELKVKTENATVRLEESEKQQEEAATRDVKVDLAFPDGGWRAWGVVVGASCTTCATFGYVNSWGAFQVYYENNKFPDQSPSSIAWIGSIQYSLIFVPGIIVGRFFDIGYFRLPFMTANAALILATFLVAECTAFWQVLLCQGILTGFACGVMFSPLLAVLSHWFDKKRHLAIGLIAVGSAIGGTVVPILVRALLPAVGFQWTMRILAFVLLGFTAISNALIRPRLEPRKATGRLVNFGQFKNLAFTVYTTASVVTFLGLYTVLTYIATYATQRGISQSMAYNLVSIANASSLVGRLATGLLGDRIGPLNIMTPFTLSAGILTYAWPYAHTLETIIPLTILYGISSGAFVALIGSPVLEMGDASSAGERTGLLFSFTALGALAGPPISGAIRSSAGNWESVGYYAGSMIVLSVILMWITRVLLLKHPYKGII